MKNIFNLLLLLLVSNYAFSQSINIDAKYIYCGRFNNISFLVEKENKLLAIRSYFDFDESSALKEVFLADSVVYRDKSDFWQAKIFLKQI